MDVVNRSFDLFKNISDPFRNAINKHDELVLRNNVAIHNGIMILMS